MAVATVYRTYKFIDKDPAIDKLRTARQDAGMSYKEIVEASGVTIGTLRNWFEGGTRRPQHATLMAVAHSMGYEFRLVKSSKMAKKWKTRKWKKANGVSVEAHV